MEYDLMVDLAAPGTTLAAMRDTGLAAALRSLSVLRWWRDMLGMLRAMAAEGRPLPAGALAADGDGLSFACGWLRGAPLLARTLSVPDDGARLSVPDRA
jgi:hypothetical protein